jgi:hypothetical protein
MFFFNKKGKSRKKLIEGNTIQKIPDDKSAILPTSLVSRYSQINARKEIRGMDAKMLPNKLLRFEISDITTIMMDDIITFIM